MSYQMVGLIAEELLDNITLGRRAISGANKLEVDDHGLWSCYYIYSAIYSDETHYVS